MNLIKSGIKNINSNNLKLKLIYKASRDGDTPEKFHLKCDGISPTISIIFFVATQIKIGIIILLI